MSKPKSVIPIAKIKNNLRRLHMHCKYKAKAKARCKIDTALYLCEESGCKVAHYEGTSEKNFFKTVEKYIDDYEVVWKKIEMDHLFPVIEPKKGFGNWDDYFHALWVDDTGYRGLCRDCHAAKTADEMEERVKAGSLKRKK